MRALRGLTAALVALTALALPAAAGAQERWRLTAAEAIAIAAGTPQMRAERAAHRRSFFRAFRDRGRRWRVSLYEAPAGQEQVQVLVDDRSGRVLEAWTGVRARWPMARGYPGFFGRAANTWWIWAGLSVLFVLPFLRGPPRILHLDLAVLLAFSLSYAAFYTANLGLSVPTVYPLLAYLLARMLWVAWHPRHGPPPLRVTANFLTIALMFLIGVRIALNLTGNVIDVGYASVVGADRLAGGEPLYGAFVDPIAHGDTYGPVAYAAYVPFEQVLPVGRGLGRPAGRARGGDRVRPRLHRAAVAAWRRARRVLVGGVSVHVARDRQRLE